MVLANKNLEPGGLLRFGDSGAVGLGFLCVVNVGRSVVHFKTRTHTTKAAARSSLLRGRCSGLLALAHIGPIRYWGLEPGSHVHDAHPFRMNSHACSSVVHSHSA